MASKSVAAVAAAAGLPASNISATYTEAKPTGRRMLTTPETSSSSSSAGVAATYTLSAAQPAAVAEQVVTAVNDGSLQQELQTRLDLPSSPVVSLTAAGESGDPPEVLLKPTSLEAAAAEAAADVAAAIAAAVSSSAGAIAAAKGGAVDQPAAAAASSSSSSSSRTGAIVGGVVGGVCGAAVLAGVAWWCIAGAKKRQQQQPQQSKLSKDVLGTSASGSSWNGDDGSSVISGSTSTGNLKSVDIVMHVIEDDGAAPKGGKALAA
jgi:hypothetical protein